MITLVEKQIKVLDREYLYNLVEEREDINDFTKDLLLDFIDGICTELSELGFQMNRQPMNLYIHKEYTNLKNDFVKLIEDLLEVDLSSVFNRDKLVQSFQGTAETYIDNLQSLTKNDVAEQAEKCRERINAYVSNLLSNSNGLLDIEEQAENDTNKKLTISEVELDDFYKPKHFSMNTNKPNNTEKKFKKRFTRIDKY